MNPFLSFSAAEAMREARMAALTAALDLALKEIGVEKLEGLAVPAWIHKRTALELQNFLILMEDKNPALAAQIQQHLDDAAKKISDDSQTNQ